MKVAVAGTRDLEISDGDIELALCLLNPKWEPQEITILTGCCPTGADAIARRFADRLYVKVFAAEWDKCGRAAGPIRTREMIAEADALVAFWNGKSNGTRHALEMARAKRIPIIQVVRWAEK